ncbi:MAG: D-alanine--D-alanine ligase [Erysipelotrichaceae bacterium]|nr:D-alanine--D-alanine ligase [Erysipelotrichaceae bacterium]
MKTTVAILFGGKSSEYGVSLHSTASVLQNIPDTYDVMMVGITKDGNWYEYHGDIEHIEHDQWLEGDVTPCVLSVDTKDHGFIVRYPDHEEVRRVDVVFPVMHGPNGEDGTIQGVCKLAGIPVVGCGMLSSALCMDKEYTHIIAKHCGVGMAEYLTVRKEEASDFTALYETVKNTLGIPCIIKPANAGSSFGVSKVKNKESFADGLNDAFLYDDKVIIEEFVEGFEVGCAVLGNHAETLGEPDEIEMVTDIFDFNEKYNDASTIIHVPARVTAEQKEAIYNIARTIYKGLSCEGMARVDCFVQTDGSVVLNELNTIPGFTSHSRYPSMMKAVGYSFAEVIDSVIRCALHK